MDETLIEDAQACADRAAAAAGIRVREAHTLDEFAAVRSVTDRVWSADPTNPVATVELLRAYSHTGQYVVLAEDLRSAEPFPHNVIAVSIGFLGAPVGRALHSNVTGVLPPGRGRSLGHAIKLHQRAWALRQGLELITWTFDPLIRRNAWFNLAKLGARPQEYLVNFYGAMGDRINAGDASDRMYVHWPLADPVVAATCAGTTQVLDAGAVRAAGAQVLLEVGEDGGPRVLRSNAAAHDADSARLGDDSPRLGDDSLHSRSTTRLVQVPPDVERLRTTDPGLAAAWRVALREALGGSMASGWSVRGVGRDGWYVLEHTVNEESA